MGNNAGKDGVLHIVERRLKGRAVVRDIACVRPRLRQPGMTHREKTHENPYPIRLVSYKRLNCSECGTQANNKNLPHGCHLGWILGLGPIGEVAVIIPQILLCRQADVSDRQKRDRSTNRLFASVSAQSDKICL